MLIPVRCFTCGKVIGHLWETYNARVDALLADGADNTTVRGQVLNELNLDRYCCRRMLLTHVDVIDTLLKYANNPGEKVPPQFHYTDVAPEDTEAHTVYDTATDAKGDEDNAEEEYEVNYQYVSSHDADANDEDVNDENDEDANDEDVNANDEEYLDEEDDQDNE